MFSTIATILFKIIVFLIVFQIFLLVNSTIFFPLGGVLVVFLILLVAYSMIHENTMFLIFLWLFLSSITIWVYFFADNRRNIKDWKDYDIYQECGERPHIDESFDMDEFFKENVRHFECVRENYEEWKRKKKDQG